MVRKVMGVAFAPLEVLGVLIVIGLGVLVLLAIEIGLRLRSQPARTGLMVELRDETRLIAEKTD